MEITSFKELIDNINHDLNQIGFCNRFAETRFELGRMKRMPERIVFKYDNKKGRDWAINPGGGTEIQYHIYYKDNTIGYGLGFNMQYVPFKGNMSPEDLIKPYCDAFLFLYESNKDKWNNTYSWIYGDVDLLKKPKRGEYALYGKTIDVVNNSIDDAAYGQLLNDIKTELFDIYTQVFDRKNKMEDNKKRDIIMIKDISKLYTKKNIILQGAPGTGKTYNTAEIALNICGIDTSSLSREALMQEYAKLIKAGQIAFTTFHQTMDYDDFVEGLKPQVEDGKVIYDVEDGIFKKICQDARIKDESNFDECYDKLLNDIQEKEHYPIKSSGGSTFHVAVNSKQNLTLYTGPDKKMNGVLTKEGVRMEYFGQGLKYWGGYYQGVVDLLYKEYDLKKPSQSTNKNYVLIIDEINRGNISKIFGELITLLESDKREGETNCISAKLAYSKIDFTVPNNLYIIGTMNTTDRSVGNIDYAIRRRFAFYTLESSWEIAEGSYTDSSKKDEARKLYDAVRNYIIQSAIDMDVEDLMVGHSYFMDNGQELKQRWDFEILPLLNEYYKDGICSKSPLDGIRDKKDGKAEKELYMQKFIDKYKS